MTVTAQKFPPLPFSNGRLARNGCRQTSVPKGSFCFWATMSIFSGKRGTFGTLRFKTSFCVTGAGHGHVFIHVAGVALSGGWVKMRGGFGSHFVWQACSDESGSSVVASVVFRRPGRKVADTR